MQLSLQKLLPDISHGDHCCLLYSSRQDQVEATVPFLALGLERNERCVYVGDDDSIGQIRSGLKGAGVSLESELQKKRLILSSGHDYLESGRFDTDKMLSFLQQSYDSALKDGFAALRATGDVSWEVGPEKDFSNIVYYETLLDVFFLGKKMVGMCQYPKHKCPPEVISGILTSHKIAALDQVICSNFHYVPAEVLFEKDTKARHEKRVEWMTSQLMRARLAEETIMQLNIDLERRVAERTAALNDSLQDVESFSRSVSHDLRAPIRGILGRSKIVLEDYGSVLDSQGREHLQRVVTAAERMDQLVEGMLKLARLSQHELSCQKVDLTQMVREIAAELAMTYPNRRVTFLAAEEVCVTGDPDLLRIVMTNLLNNAWKFTSKKKDARVQFGLVIKDDQPIYFVKDNGAGFDESLAHKLFQTFERLHSTKDFDGTGIGLATVHRVVIRHGGKVWAEGKVDEGATFYFSLPDRENR
ncbi:MAG: MEDS domain-containing protein [Nitrospira sp.]